MTIESLKTRVRKTTLSRIHHIYEAGVRGSSVATAELAQLRRGVGKRPGEILELVGLTFGDLYGEDPPKSDDPTSAEFAVYNAMTLFALHQQSKGSASMHQSGFGFGRSTRLLGKKRPGNGNSDPIRARFNGLGNASSVSETVNHARGLIQLFRAEDIPLDYGQFAVDLYDLQYPSGANRVRLAWGRDFFRLTDTDTFELHKD